ncbi:HAUS augmin-like complex subunit 4 [Podarcis raffonei]|uniref:HAUS augmin-like complex subunit 4 n=1 Tax=Podarcis raffonei TaxID=65483 RepID=UPI0023298051|nr:HAUS augmin-like complex subunit 4 [Podarcis raffonei]XP_053219847.1 HAUS augmin-like complex subunit 4 [Podarcis raffonei]XP_053219848.1 HAUS augmin-like complex subunit 4 [Podarcis raffonei]
MASALGTVGVQLLRQPGCGSCLPPCSLTDEDLAAYPGLANLLLGLTSHMDSSGLSVHLAQQMEEARKELQRCRGNWLKWEVVHRLLQEALRELGTGLSPRDQKFLEVLEQQLSVAELKRMLDLGPSLQDAQPSLLGLEASDLQELLPPNQELEQMRKHLPAELEKRLKSKCLAVLGYYLPESDGAGEAARAAMLGTLAERLAAEKRHLRESQARHQELVGLLEQQKAAYPQVLLRCLAILKRLARELRLNAQSELDYFSTQYLETKCNAMFFKIRLEELSILLETYTPEKVDVHRMMRDKLQAALSQEEQDLATSRKIVSNYETLGPDFEELVKEYARLQAIIENRRWALREFSKD